MTQHREEEWKAEKDRVPWVREEEVECEMVDKRIATTAIRVSEENGGMVVIGYITRDGLLNILQSKPTRNCSGIYGMQRCETSISFIVFN